jgi:hypothetical protein
MAGVPRNSSIYDPAQRIFELEQQKVGKALRKCQEIKFNIVLSSIINSASQWLAIRAQLMDL